MSPEELHARAIDLFRKGDTAGGITDLKAYIEAEPDDDEPTQPLARQCRRVWPTVEARLDTGE